MLPHNAVNTVLPQQTDNRTACSHGSVGTQVHRRLTAMQQNSGTDCGGRCRIKPGAEGGFSTWHNSGDVKKGATPPPATLTRPSSVHLGQPSRSSSPENTMIIRGLRSHAAGAVSRFSKPSVAICQVKLALNTFRPYVGGMSRDLQSCFKVRSPTRCLAPVLPQPQTGRNVVTLAPCRHLSL